MTLHPQGNGSGKITVNQQDMGGWLRVHADKTAVFSDDLGVYLSHAMTVWFRQRPQLVLRCVVPIVRDGYTVELHGWYSLHAFPDTSGQTPIQDGNSSSAGN